MIARVGGNPSEEAAARHPLRYMITWAFEHVLRECSVPLLVIKDGRVKEVLAGSDRETFNFRHFGQEALLECAVTPGMPSFIYTRSYLREFAEKTVRWPGHWQGIQTLKECGLLDLDPVEFDGRPIVPRRFLFSLLTPALQPQRGETDITVMYNTVSGKKAGKEHKIETFLWSEADPRHGFSSMMRTTGFPAAIGARLLGQGKLNAKGIIAPEDAVHGANYDYFMEELHKRGLEVQWEQSP